MTGYEKDTFERQDLKNVQKLHELWDDFRRIFLNVKLWKNFEYVIINSS